VRELLENSGWWSRADRRGVEYDKGVRAVTRHLRDIDDDSLRMFAGGNIRSKITYALIPIDLASWPNIETRCPVRRAGLAYSPLREV
jgi:hypothetical protein